jgi:GTP-binding protein
MTPTSPKIVDATFVASSPAPEGLPAPAFAEVAFAGRSNVGKSSLINALVERRKLVRTSATPGCTRGINLFRIQLHDPAAVLDLVDLPGYGYAKRSKTERRSWGKAIEQFLETRAGLRAVVVIVDVRRGIEQDDEALLAFLGAHDIRSLLVATKADKIPPSKRKPVLREIQQGTTARVILFSAESADGRDELWDAVLRACAIER